MKTLSIIGSTGSIGRNAVEVISAKKDDYKVIALTCGKNVNELIGQAKIFRPEVVAVQDKERYSDLKDGLRGLKTEILCGDDGVIAAASVPADVSVISVVGAAGLRPALAAAANGRVVALANKETLVCAGGLFLSEIEKHHAVLLPVDSEHSAIFQSLEKENKDEIDHIVLTASGGPFRTLTMDELKHVTVRDALKHPNWSMGRKITIDSATMMNKGLEIIEAYHLFPVGLDQIRVVIHPESIMHSGVMYKDGALIAELGVPDMKCPISYALTYPKRAKAPVRILDLTELNGLHFYKPDYEKFKSINLAKDALREGGTAPCAMNAANEVAVDAFLNGRIKFLEIFDIVKKTLESMNVSELKCLDDVFETDRDARIKAESFIMNDY